MLTGWTDVANECPECHGSSRIAHGLCLGCLLKTGLDDDAGDSEKELAAALDSVGCSDRNWRFGNYEILEEIGRGGMGVIYRARQRHSRRVVALKRVLSYHADSHDTLARFRREAEAAASLDHPNILPIYEVSQTADGVPYFSMKYAPGGTLQAISPALRDNPNDVVELMAKVSRAMEYAHEQGILHRDLKPGNILLDGRGEPMVSDFGLAKWLDASTNLTRTLTIFGTPGYIAPEQADGPSSGLGPAADVYSLGAILFDLLAGRPPFLGEHALAVIRQAQQNSAPKLSSVVANADRDLETICARCLERQPSERYHSAGKLAEDLERWLAGRPIVARPVSPVTRLRRWAKRNPVISIGGGVILGLLGLVAALITLEVRSQREMARLRQGVMEYAVIDAETRQPGERQSPARISAALGEKFGVEPKSFSANLEKFANHLELAPDASDYERASAAYIGKNYVDAESLALGAADDARKTSIGAPESIIQALQLAGFAAQARIHFPQAMEHFRDAEKLADVNRDPKEWATLQNAIADLLFAQGKYRESETLFRQVIELRTRILGPGHPETLTARHRLIYVLDQEEKHAEAETEARQVVAMRERILGFEHPDTLLSRYNLASALYHAGKYPEAEAIYREVLRLDEKIIGPEEPRTLAARVGLANSLNDQGKYPEAEACYREAIKLDQKVYGPEHPVTLNDRMNLATALQADHKYLAAEAEYQNVIELQTKVLGPEHADTLNTRNGFAEMLDDEGKYAEAEAECRAILGAEEKVVGPLHRLTLNTRANLAVALIAQGRCEETEGHYLEIARLMEETLGGDYPDTVTFTLKFANGLARQHRTDQAIKLLNAASESARQKLGPDHPLLVRYAGVLHELGVSQH